ncbi:Carboxypeptidase E [Nymphon striatum]|nr:Carboxypeptidase E [Nymphon striatum]
MRGSILVLSLTILSALYLCSCFEIRHHDNAELRQSLENVTKKCPNISRIYELSHKSVRGLPLTVIHLTTNVHKHAQLKPAVKYVGNMHGNEVLGREMLLILADFLCNKYLEKDPEIFSLLNTTSIHILPSMNPDGWDIATSAGGSKAGWLVGRDNSNGVDLNRDFRNLDKLAFARNIELNNHLAEIEQRVTHEYQPETKAMMDWILSQKDVVISANLHGGDLVANYPYDQTIDGSEHTYTASPDDKTFRQLARSYASMHKYMAKVGSKKPCSEKDFTRQGGITNGADWYSVAGGMQDFNYLSSNAFEITLEIGCVKYPEESVLPDEWDNNRPALINFMWQAHIGVKGIVYDAESGMPIEEATIKVLAITPTSLDYIDHDITTLPSGEYFRLLVPGQYRVIANAPGYTEQGQIVHIAREDELEDEENNRGRLTEADM